MDLRVTCQASAELLSRTPAQTAPEASVQAPAFGAARDVYKRQAPSKAVNAGGVAVSGLEMSQNSERLAWSAEEVDQKLVTIMKNIHKASVEAAEECGLGYNLVAGANIAGFKKVADAMMAQGLV